MRILLLMFIAITLLTGCATLAQGKASFQQQNYDLAFKQLNPLANRGNADAQYAVGYMYYYGKGVIEDPKMAIYWFKQAAAQGQPNAVTALQMLAISNINAQANSINGTDIINENLQGHS